MVLKMVSVSLSSLNGARSRSTYYYYATYDSAVHKTALARRNYVKNLSNLYYFCIVHLFPISLRRQQQQTRLFLRLRGKGLFLHQQQSSDRNLSKFWLLWEEREKLLLLD